MELALKRVYEAPEKEDGYRILVDRIWPRGVKKETANLDLWLKEVAPTTELRKWFGHDAEKWEDFQKKYKKELKDHEEEIQKIKAPLKKGKVTLVYAAKDEAHNQAVVLKDFLTK